MNRKSQVRAPRPDAFDRILEIMADARGAFAGLQAAFSQNHDDYCEWLQRRIREKLLADNVKEILSHLGLDWLTLHYRTRHPVQPWSREREWIQMGLPLELYLQRWSNDLLTYRQSGSPYISEFSEEFLRSGQPLIIALGIDEAQSGQAADNYLGLASGLSNFLASITKGSESQGALLPEEMKKAREMSREDVELICFRLQEWTGGELEDRVALGLLRDTCRVTFLGLGQFLVFKPPRIVVLAPVHVRENTIGGIAFIGRALPGVLEILLSSRPRSFLLQQVANTLLTGIRLQEEPEREAQTGRLEELTRARADFVQRVAHRLQSPLDGLLLRVGDAVAMLGSTQAELEKTKTKLAKIKEEVDNLRAAAEEIIKAFGREDIDSFLKFKMSRVLVREILDTLLFVHGRAFQEKGTRLDVIPMIEDIPADWTVEMDKTSFSEVMANLLTNALRFANSTVTLSVEREKEHYIFRVKDDGPGVHESIVGRLFQPGVREAKQEGDSQAHGFGLYLSKIVAEKHGGRILLSRTSKAGSEFVVELPIASEPK